MNRVLQLGFAFLALFIATSAAIAVFYPAVSTVLCLTWMAAMLLSFGFILYGLYYRDPAGFVLRKGFPQYILFPQCPRCDGPLTKKSGRHYCKKCNAIFDEVD